MRAEFKVGKWWWLGWMILRLVAVMVGIFAAATPHSAVVVVTALLGLLAVVIGYVCQRNADSCQALGERTRRAIVLQDGLGWAISPGLERNLRLSFSGPAKHVARQLTDLSARL
jgi:hypothetical protein